MCQFRPDPEGYQVEQHEVVGEDQDQHRADEEVHVGKETRIARIVRHVLGRVEMDQRSDDCHDQDHHQRQGIEVKGDRRCEIIHRHPRPEGLGEGVAFRR